MEELVRLAGRLAWGLPRDLLAERASRFRDMWRGVQGNARALVACNIFWTVPISFSGIYLQLFMHEQGLTPVEIGSVGSTQLVVQVAGALLGGWMAHRLGRLRVVTWVDAVCWPLAYLCFALADGYLAFTAGAALVGGVALLMPSWNSLFIQGSAPGSRAHLFGILQVPWFVGAILASGSYFLVREIGVSRSCRWTFGAAALLTAFAVWYRSRFLADPDPPPRPLRPSFREAEAFFRGHWLAFQRVVRRPGLRIAFAMQVLFQGGLIVSGMFNNLYLADPRGGALPAEQLALLPLAGGTTVLLTTFLVVPRVSAENQIRFLRMGIALIAANIGLLLAVPWGGFPVAAAAALVGAIGFAVFNPTVNAFWADQIPDRARARMDSFRWVVNLALNVPVPTFAGALFKEIHPCMPLLLVLAAYLALAVLSVAAARISAREPRRS